LIDLLHGNSLELLKDLPDNSIDGVVTDPPYELGFMGKSWDASGIAYNVELWKQCLRVLKPGGHLLAFSGTRTYHRMACAIEDAGFEVRDMIEWVYGSGFPKSLNIGKAVDKLQGNERTPYERPDFVARSNKTEQRKSQVICGEKGKYTKGTSEWEGWGTALKPAHEPIAFCRKPIEKGLTIAENCLKWGVGGINIDGSRVEGTLDGDPNRFSKTDGGWGVAEFHKAPVVRNEGRFPANLIHDNSEEVRECFPDETSRFFKSILYYPKASKSERNKGCDGLDERYQDESREIGSPGGTNPRNRGAESPLKNFHPTVKPVALMEYLINMISNPGHTILDPFMGSGTTGVACKKLGRSFIGMELIEEYITIAKSRISDVEGLFD
jgi:DNA modification methylase